MSQITVILTSIWDTTLLLHVNSHKQTKRSHFQYCKSNNGSMFTKLKLFREHSYTTCSLFCRGKFRLFQKFQLYELYCVDLLKKTSWNFIHFILFILSVVGVVFFIIINNETFNDYNLKRGSTASVQTMLIIKAWRFSKIIFNRLHELFYKNISEKCFLQLIFSCESWNKDGLETVKSVGRF